MEVEDAVRDYYEGWFDGDAERMERALHRELAKRDPAAATLTAREMVDATASGTGTKYTGDQRRYEISVDDVYDRIANVTIRGPVYREYVQLVQTDEGWKIVNVLWQRT